MLRKRLPVQNNLYFIRKNEKSSIFENKPTTLLFQANVTLFFVTKIVINITLKIEKESL